MQNVGTGFSLTVLECIQQFFQFRHGALGLGLRLGLTDRGGILQLGARLVQFFLRFATLFFELGEQFLGISQSL